MEKLTLQAAAKLNLSLDIVGVRKDGYHLMDMVMQSVDLFDTVTLTKADTISLTMTDEAGHSFDGLCPPEKNTAYRAAYAFIEETGIRKGVAISLVKRIPNEAGMAGGSADAAAVLRGLNQLYHANLSEEILCRLGLSVGADVPFCLVGGTALVQGIGEIIKPQPFFDAGFILVVKPPFGISTGEAFRRFDTVGVPVHPDNSALLTAMQEQDLPKMGRVTANVLEQAADSPDIAKIKEKLLQAGAIFSLMTGSGSAVFGFFAEEEAAKSAQELLSNCGQVFLCRPVSQGVFL